jgi:hypothetical protein
MGQDAKRSYLEEIYGRYHKATRVNKAKILDEFCAVCGYHRKHAIRLLSKPLYRHRKRKQVSSRGRKAVYQNETVLSPIKRIWEAADYPCSKKLVTMIPQWLPHYEKRYGEIEKEPVQKILRVSASSLDRILKPFRVRARKRYCTTKPGKLLKNQIPIKTNQWDENQVGFMEADTVAHCGNSLAGDFAWSLTMTDIKSTWTENRAVWNKGSKEILEAIKNIEENIQFKLLGFDCDNGTEFLNYHLIRYFSERPKKDLVKFTRSRPYHKDDNAHVEQKNWTHVRQLFGYDRIDKKEVVKLMNDLYEKEWSLYQNHFCPTMKLVSKEKINSRYKKSYDKPKTPYERLIGCNEISKNKKLELKSVHEGLNPFDLREQIENKLKRIFRDVRVTSNMRQRI